MILPLLRDEVMNIIYERFPIRKMAVISRQMAVSHSFMRPIGFGSNPNRHRPIIE
jgi:hypothetical protein